MAERGYIGGTTWEPTVDAGYVGALSYTTTVDSGGGGSPVDPNAPTGRAWPIRGDRRAFPTHEFRAFPHD